MKKLLSLITAAVVLTSLLTPFITVHAASNLIANSSVEASSNTIQPDNWVSNAWGANTTTFSYSTDAHTGSKGLSITMANRTGGDAKWMHSAVTVSPNVSYTYTGFYKSNVATEIDLQYTTSAGAISYAYAAYVPASTTWKEITTTFTTPSNASKIVVMHLIAQNGTLQTDDITLSETVVAPPVTSDNGLTNPSVEVANGTIPAGWQKNSWGSNTSQFIYESIGYTGNHSVTTSISQYTNGDAKWYANAAVVVGGKNYVYQDYYKSSVTTRVIVAFMDAAGALTYKELITAPASADWAPYSAPVLAPNNAVKAYVYHLIDSVGYVTIDDVALSVAAPVTVANVPNGSLELATVNNIAPQNWQSSSWGTNTATFAYVKSAGHTGSKSVKVTVKNYVSGDAKWFYDPTTALTAGKQYRFTSWYKTNAKSPKVVALFIDKNGVEHYVGLRNALPSGSTTAWQQYTDTFVVPVDTVSTSVFMLLAENAWLQTDDYEITDYQSTGFNRPLLTMTFDDGHEDNVTTALPLLNQYGFKSTQCFATTFIEGNQTAIDAVKTFYNSGHEICSHTVTHPYLTTLSATKLAAELANSQQLLQSITGAPVKNFASPYGDYNSTVITAIKKYYQSHRTVDAGFNSKDNFDPYRLRVQNVLDTTTNAQIEQWITQAQKDNTWLILLYHRVADNPGTYDTYTSVFAQHLASIKASGITVKTYQDALTEVNSQL